MDGELVNCTASAIKEAFAAYHDEFERITHRAKERFERREWHSLHEDAEQRLDLYKAHVDDTVTRLVGVRGEGLGVGARHASPLRGQTLTPNPSPLTPTDKDFWCAVKQRYPQFSAERGG